MNPFMGDSSLTYLLCNVGFPSAIPTFDELLTYTHWEASRRSLQSQEEPGNHSEAWKADRQPRKGNQRTQGKRL